MRADGDGRAIGGPHREARKEATGPDQLEVIPRVESPASRSMKFFLSPRCTGLLSKSGPLLPPPSSRLPHARPPSVGEDCTCKSCCFRVLPSPPPPPLSLFRPLSLSNRSLSAPSGRTGVTRLDSSQLHPRFTIQFRPEKRASRGAAKHDVSIVDPSRNASPRRNPALKELASFALCINCARRLPRGCDAM